MKSLIALMVFLPGYLFAQEDSLREFQYMHKGELFLFDSGVAISDRQYQFFYRNQAYKEIKSTVSTAINNPPKVIYVDRPVRNKGDGNKLAWGGGGVAVGTLLSIIITLMVSK